jgi:hypothetical protein
MRIELCGGTRMDDPDDDEEAEELGALETMRYKSFRPV